MSRFINNYVKCARDLIDARTDFVTVTLVQPEGHVPQDMGAKAIVTREGLAWGTVGGGRLEARAIVHAKQMLEKRGREISPPELVRYDLQQDLGMVCGGAATLFYEVSAERWWRIAVFGAGHVAQSTVPLLASFSCEITCLDPREEWLKKLPQLPNLTAVHATDLPAAVASVSPDAFYVVITQGHATDLPVVREILKRGKPAYLGVIGSVPKARTLKAALVQEGFPQDLVDAVICPIGLPLGSNDPPEIAVSIAAQLLQVRGRAVTSSRDA